MNDAGTQRRVSSSWKEFLVWTSLLAADLVFFGCWSGMYVAAVIAVSVTSIAVIRRILGLWAAYLTALPTPAVGFFYAISTIGGPPEELYQVLEELLLCLAFGAVWGAPAALGVTCLLQFIVDSLASTPQAATPTSGSLPQP